MLQQASNETAPSLLLACHMSQSRWEGDLRGTINLFRLHECEYGMERVSANCQLVAHLFGLIAGVHTWSCMAHAFRLQIDLTEYGLGE